MAATFTLIASNILSVDTASVTFSSIPQIYTDLLLTISARSDSSYAGVSDDIVASYGGSWTLLQYDGASVTGSRQTGNTWLNKNSVGNSATNNTFSNSELYIPNYTLTGNKTQNVFSVSENNATSAYISLQTRSSSATTAISSITLSPSNANNFVAKSSFFLYGILKS